MVTIGGDDFQPGCLADRLLTGLGQPQTNPKVTQVTSKKEWKKSLLQQIGHVKLASLLQMSETQIANELLHGNLCGSQHFLFEHCTTLQSIERCAISGLIKAGNQKHFHGILHHQNFQNASPTSKIT